jgi:hypothetical protein
MERDSATDRKGGERKRLLNMHETWSLAPRRGPIDIETTQRGGIVTAGMRNPQHSPLW